MTKEELVKEVEDVVYGMGYDTYESDGHSDSAVQDIFVKFAEPREKRIAELEKENAELIHENARLVTVIDKSKSWGISPLNYLIIKNLDDQLTNAKELIEKLLNAFSSNDFFEEEELIAMAEAENFLKESEVEK